MKELDTDRLARSFLYGRGTPPTQQESGNQPFHFRSALFVFVIPFPTSTFSTYSEGLVTRLKNNFIRFQTQIVYMTVASEAYHDWSGKAADAQIRVNFTLKSLLSQNLMRFMSFASNIGPAVAVPAGPAPPPPPHERTMSCTYCANYVSMTAYKRRLHRSC